MKAIKLLSLTVAILVFTQCTKNEPAPTEFYGEDVSLGSGTVKSFYRTDDAGNPNEIGVAISQSALNSLSHSSSQFVLKLPTEAQGKTPFNFVLFDFNHAGHEPAKIYDVAHFDVHFYLTSNENRLKIIPTDKDVAAPPADGYLPMPSVPAGVVPQMGNHWIDVTSPELSGAKFTNTFIYGSAFGKVTFLEPMIAVDYLKTNPQGHFAIKQPQKFEKAGYYPSEYCAIYNAEAKQYEIAIEAFKMK